MPMTKARRTFRYNGAAQVTFDFPSISAVNKQTTTVNVPGAQVGDHAQVTASVATNGVIYTAYVSSASTVTIVANNPTAGAIDPASTVFSVLVQRL